MSFIPSSANSSPHLELIFFLENILSQKTAFVCLMLVLFNITTSGKVIYTVVSMQALRRYRGQMKSTAGSSQQQYTPVGMLFAHSNSEQHRFIFVTSSPR